MPKRAVFERSRQELSLDVSVGVHILLIVEQSSLESKSRGCAKKNSDTYGYGDKQADAGRDCQTRLVRPNSQARTRTEKYSFSLFC